MKNEKAHWLLMECVVHLTSYRNYLESRMPDHDFIPDPHAIPYHMEIDALIKEIQKNLRK